MGLQKSPKLNQFSVNLKEGEKVFNTQASGESSVASHQNIFVTNQRQRAFWAPSISLEQRVSP